LALPHRAVKVINILIAVSLLAGAAIVIPMALVVVGGGPVITVGPVISHFQMGTVNLHVPLSIRNGGVLDIKDVGVALTVLDPWGDPIITGSTGSFTVAELLNDNQQMVFPLDE
jgi:hypothetical protein